MNLHWVIVSYGGVSEAWSLISSLDPQKYPWVKFLVCCNRAGDYSEAQSLIGASPWKSSIAAADFSDNPGYLPAFARAIESIDASNWLVLSNADLEGDGQVLGRLEAIGRSLNSDDEVVMIAPSIVGRAGHDANPYFSRPPRARSLRIQAVLHRNRFVADLYAAIGKRRSDRIAQRRSRVGQSDMWAPHGACVIFTPWFLGKGGSLEYPFKLFGEEIWLGTEAERVRGRVSYAPSVVLRHREHGAIGDKRRGLAARSKRDTLDYWAKRARERRW